MDLCRRKEKQGEERGFKIICKTCLQLPELYHTPSILDHYWLYVTEYLIQPHVKIHVHTKPCQPCIIAYCSISGHQYSEGICVCVCGKFGIKHTPASGKHRGPSKGQFVSFNCVCLSAKLNQIMQVFCFSESCAVLHKNSRCDYYRPWPLAKKT